MLDQRFWTTTSDVQLGLEVAIRQQCPHCLAAMSRTMGVLGKIAEVGTDHSKFAKVVEVESVLCVGCKPAYEEDVAAEVAIAEVALTARNPRTLDMLRKWATIEKA